MVRGRSPVQSRPLAPNLIHDSNIERAPEIAREASRTKDALENFLGLGLVIIGIVVAASYLGGEDLRAWVEGAGNWGPLALILAKTLTIVAAPLSGGPLYPVAGALFGTGPAILYLVIGDALGGAIAFALARRFGRRLVERLLQKSNSGFLDRAIALMGTAKGFFVARVCFVAIQEVPAYGAGLTKLRFLPFILIHTGVGLVPIVTLAWLGDAAFTGHSGWLLALGLIGGTVVAAAGTALFAHYTRKPKAQMHE